MLNLLLAVVLSLATEPLAPQPQSDAPFPQEIPTVYGAADGLPGEDVRAVALLADGTPVAAAREGLAAFRDGVWHAMAGPDFSVERLCVADGTLWAAGEAALARFDGAAWRRVALPAEVSVSGMAASGGEVLLSSPQGLWRVGKDGARRVAGLETRHVVVLDGEPVVATDGNLFRVAADGSLRALPRVADDRHSWLLRDIGALAAQDGHLWFGAGNGAGRFAEGQWALFTGREGLPYDRFTCAASGESGVVWFGTERGALRFDGAGWSYRASRRWLPDDRVNAIAVAPDGTAWIATAKGVSRIARRPMTLAEKAAEFERIVDERHTRMGYVVRCLMREEGDLSTAWINHTDNDGLYTGMYGAAECFRYAATGDPEAKRRANRTLDALKLLVDVTGIPGFPARSVIPVDWPEDPNRGHTAESNLAIKAQDPLWKEILPRWPKSADGQYYWKCDTSSDETCGHYFFYAVYHDLVAETEEEKAKVADLVRAVTDHIVDNGFVLVDHDGLPTRWGNWSPEYVNGPLGWADRGLQSVEILSYLNTALHITGDQKYAEAARYLRDRHAYHVNAISGRATFPPQNVVAWDNNLSFLSYYGLLKYETDPELRALYRTSLDKAWLFVSRQNDPFFNFIYAAVLPDADKPLFDDVYADLATPVAKGIETLRGTPLSLIGWEMKNSHRLDVVQDPTARQRPGYGWSVVTEEALPIQERCHIRINSDHFALDHSQGGGSTEYEGTFFLLPYYIALYQGYVK